MQLIDPGQIPMAVSVEEFRRAAHVDCDDDDTLIEAYLRAAQEVIEVATRRPLTERTVQIDLPRTCAFDVWWFPIAPVVEVLTFAAVSIAGDVDAAPDMPVIVRSFDEPQLAFSSSQSSWLQGYRHGVVTAKVGYAETKSPLALRQAIILLTKEWFDHGMALGDQGENDMSFAVKALIRQQRYRRPQEVC